jgi:hypothetical protein
MARYSADRPRLGDRRHGPGTGVVCVCMRDRLRPAFSPRTGVADMVGGVRRGPPIAASSGVLPSSGQRLELVCGLGGVR